MVTRGIWYSGEKEGKSSAHTPSHPLRIISLPLSLSAALFQLFLLYSIRRKFWIMSMFRRSWEESERADFLNCSDSVGKAERGFVREKAEVPHEKTLLQDEIVLMNFLKASMVPTCLT